MKLRALGCRWRGMTCFVALLVCGMHFWPYALIGAGYSFVYSEAGIQAVRNRLEAVRWYQDANGSAVVLVKNNGARWMMHSGYPSLLFDGTGRLIFLESLIGAGLTSLLPPWRCNRALVLGFGTGISAGVIASHFEEVLVYEIWPAMLELAQENFPEANRHVLKQPNVTVRLQDGVLGAASSDKKYNGIWVNVPSPGMRGAEKVLAKETLVALKRSLADDGLVFFWMHTKLGRRVLRVLNKTITHVMAPCRYFLLGPRYIQMVRAPHMTRTDFMAMEPRRLNDLARYINKEFGVLFATSEWLVSDRGWDDASPTHTYDQPWFDTRALYVAMFDRSRSASLGRIFTPGHPKRFCVFVRKAGFDYCAQTHCPRQ